ncbi:MAG: hypothetical protein JXA78_11780 [Anaerolineales bacterium]|nr:hypothetical protein [Anaerolineales bacterium]
MDEQDTYQSIETEFDFILPRGYIDHSGQVHRRGRMRLATALDEILALQDPSVQANEAYLPVALLSRVVLRLGELPAITPAVIEGVFAADMAYLEDLYLRLNSPEVVILGAVCPRCHTQFQLQVAPIDSNA